MILLWIIKLVVNASFKLDAIHSIYTHKWKSFLFGYLSSTLKCNVAWQLQKLKKINSHENVRRNMWLSFNSVIIQWVCIQTHQLSHNVKMKTFTFTSKYITYSIFFVMRMFDFCLVIFVSIVFFLARTSITVIY